MAKPSFWPSSAIDVLPMPRLPFGQPLERGRDVCINPGVQVLAHAAASKESTAWAASPISLRPKSEMVSKLNAPTNPYPDLGTLDGCNTSGAWLSVRLADRLQP